MRATVQSFACTIVHSCVCVCVCANDCIAWSSSDDKWYMSMTLNAYQTKFNSFVTCAIVRYSLQLQKMYRTSHAHYTQRHSWRRCKNKNTSYINTIEVAIKLNVTWRSQWHQSKCSMLIIFTYGTLRKKKKNCEMKWCYSLFQFNFSTTCQCGQFSISVCVTFQWTDARNTFPNFGVPIKSIWECSSSRIWALNNEYWVLSVWH